MSAAPLPSRKTAPPARPPARLWFFRAFTALVIPALLILVLEGGLHLAGIGRPTGFLIPDRKPGYLRTNPDFLSRFLPENFGLRPLNYRVAAHKPANTVRIVVLGESAAQGVPVPAFAFAPQLRAQLRARYPGKDIEVINTGGVAINSHVVYQIARDLAQYSPDLFVVYLGNNEVVGPYGPGCTYLSDMRPLWMIRLGVWVRITRTGQVVAATMARIASWKKRPPEWGGMAMFVDNAVRGDDPRLPAVYQNFEANLRDIVRVANNAGAQTLLCTVVSNLKDSPPFLSLHSPGMTESAMAAWQQAFDRGRLAWLLGEQDAARTALQEARRIDPQYADTAYLLGKVELQSGNVAAARRLFLDAALWDGLRFRPDPRINEITRQVAQESGPQVSLVDAALLMGSDPKSTGPIAGGELLFEHVHFNWEGNFQTARLLAQGAETALQFSPADQRPWLDSPAAAAALAYTPYEHLGVLQRIADIMRNPPFSNQLSYFEDQARLAREISRAAAVFSQPATQRAARIVAEAAMVADPDNPALAGIAEGIATELNDLPGALQQARRAAELLPADAVQQTGQASLLAQLGQFPEAEQLLQEAAKQSADPDKLAPSLAALYARKKQFEEGRAFLDRAVARHPTDTKLRVARGNHWRLAGNQAAAEQEFRSVLQADPGNLTALEALVSLLAFRGQTAAAEEASLAVAEHQTRNQANNLRVAQIYEARGEEAEAARFFQAAERSGSVPVALEVNLAQKLHRLGRNAEALICLAKARRLSLEEADAEITASIDGVIARLRGSDR